MNRPRTNLGSMVTTPRTEATVSLLGARLTHESVAISRDEYRAIQRVYGFTEGARQFQQAGADRNAARHAAADGLRLLAWLARYVDTGEDPLRTLVQLAVDAGLDVDPEDVEWSEG